PMMATGCPSFTVLPAGTRILSSTPLSKERYSIVALSVSTSASRSSTSTASPSFLCHTESWPSSIVGESLGMSRTLAIRDSSPGVDGRSGALHDAGGAGDHELLERCVVRHGDVEEAPPADRGVEVVEGQTLEAIDDLGADAAVGPAFVCDHRVVGLLD